MAMSPGNQAITGGTVLRAPAIQSPDYVAGTAGWIIRQDGTAEFNSGTFRGSIAVGSDPGQHFVVNNSATGDVIDVYNSSNQLVFSIDASGNSTSFAPGSLGDPYTRFHNGRQEFNNASGFTTNDPPAVYSPSIAVGGTSLEIYSGSPASGDHPSFLELFGGATSAGAEIRASQRDVTGDLLQLDSANNDRSLVHVATYNVTTDGSGVSTFNHNCLFTPVAGFLAGVNGIGANFPWQYAWFANPFTSTTAHAKFVDNFGANLASTTLGIFGMFFG